MQFSQIVVGIHFDYR